MSRKIISLIATLTLLLLLAPPGAQASKVSSVVHANGGHSVEVSNTEDLMHREGLAENVKVNNHVDGDGVVTKFEVTSTKPTGTDLNISIPLKDKGKWATPVDEPTGPKTPHNPQATADAIKRGQTFHQAGKALVWDADRKTPLDEIVVHQEYDQPHALTCSSFVGMVLAGYDYQNSTFTQDKNQQVGSFVDFKMPVPDMGWQAWKLLNWFVQEDSQQDVWRHDPNNHKFETGDLLFFSKLDPEGTGTTGSYYRNVYHVALYIGDNKVLHSISPDSEYGVMEEKLNTVLMKDLSYVARPQWAGQNTSNTSLKSPEATEQTGKTSPEASAEQPVEPAEHSTETEADLDQQQDEAAQSESSATPQQKPTQENSVAPNTSTSQNTTDNADSEPSPQASGKPLARTGGQALIGFGLALLLLALGLFLKRNNSKHTPRHG